MASSINGASINVSGSPDIKYYVTYTASRSSNSSVNYNFTIKTYVVGSSSSWLGNGYKLTLYLTVNGVQKSVVLKEDDAVWSGGSSSGTLKSTKTLSLTCTSTSGNTNQTVTFQVVNKGTLDGSAGEITTTNYYVTSPALLYTACTAPTTITVSSNNFEDNVTIQWSGASGGTNNSIKYYYIQYAVSSNNSTWGDWTGLKSVASTSTSGSYTTDMSSKVSRGYYVKFRIRTEGSAGSSYYSGYKTSSSIRRNPHTVCTAPTTFTISQDVTNNDGFTDSVTLTWSGASGGTNNSINAYLIQYSVCNDNASFNAWTTLQTISTTKTSYSFAKDVSVRVARGQYVKFRIRTQGTAGSSYYSNYKVSNSLKRNPYSNCTAPTSITIMSEATLDNIRQTNVFNNQVTLSWSGASGGASNNIERYYIEYCTSSNNSTWSSWDSLQSSNLTPAGTSSTTVNVSAKVGRGSYIKFRIRTEGEAGSTYYSPYLTSSSIRRNSIPATPTLSVATPTSLEYSYGDIISLKWDKPTDADNNIDDYEVSIRYTQNGVWTSWQVLNLTLTNTAYTFSKSNSIYPSILNNEKVQFRIRAKDVFGEYSSSYSVCSAITRYDITGVSIGINGKWVNCQIYVGQNGSWVEQSVSAGINNAWVDADEGV